MSQNCHFPEFNIWSPHSLQEKNGLSFNFISLRNKEWIMEKKWEKENTAFLHKRLVCAHKQTRNVLSSKIILHHHVHCTVWNIKCTLQFISSQWFFKLKPTNNFQATTYNYIYKQLQLFSLLEYDAIIIGKQLKIFIWRSWYQGLRSPFFLGYVDPEDGERTLLQNAGNHLPMNTSSYPIWTEPSSAPLWEPKI